MRTRTTLAGIAATATLAAAAPAQAADEVVATVAKPTTVDASRGHAVWSAWDPAINAYRLVQYTRSGEVRATRLPPNAVPFDVDLGKDPYGGTMAVFSRCDRPALSTFALNGRRGCDIYYARLSTEAQVKIRGASGPADEYWPTVWNGRIAFTRTYKPRGNRNRRYVYWRPLSGTGPSHRLRRGPDGGLPEELDMRGRRVTYLWNFEFGGQLRVADTGGGGRVLVRVPGSGAQANQLDAQGPTLSAGMVHWAISTGFDEPVFTEIRRFDLQSDDQTRATTRIEGDSRLGRATESYAYDGGVSWYVHAVAADRFEIHRVTGLRYEPAPPLELK